MLRRKEQGNDLGKCHFVKQKKQLVQTSYECLNHRRAAAGCLAGSKIR